jgi:hypothetical protein
MFTGFKRFSAADMMGYGILVSLRATTVLQLLAHGREGERHHASISTHV